MKLRKNLAILLGATALLMNGCNDTKVVSSTENYIHVGANWADLGNLKGDESYKLTVKSVSDTYKIGDYMSFKVSSRRNGFLYVLYTDQQDKTIWLYPNELSGDNTIEKSRTFTVPAKDGAWHIQASGPTGKSLLTFFLFTNDAKAKSFFKSHEDNTKSYSKDLTVVMKKDDYGVANVVIEVTE